MYGGDLGASRLAAEVWDGVMRCREASGIRRGGLVRRVECAGTHGARSQPRGQVGEWSRRPDGGRWTQEEVATVFRCAAEAIRDLDVFRTAPRWCVSSRTVFETDS